jgi:CubicO group peptidase (beta-lactamase class C family)
MANKLLALSGNEFRKPWITVDRLGPSLRFPGAIPLRSLLLPIILSFAGMTLPLGLAQPTTPLAAHIQSSAKFYRDRDGFMGVVGVQRSHHLVYGAGFGYANVEQHIPFDMDTRFRIGSLSKQFTAAAILLLQEDGKLKTRDSIGRYYKDAPAAWSNITLRNLLTHTSGIKDFDFDVVFKDSPHRPEELLRGIVAKPLEFRPGTKFEYANINYLLLGLVVEQASGEPFCRFLTDRIFQPLHLTRTGCDGKAGVVSHRAHGYHPSASGPVPFEDADLGSVAGAGSLDSSAHDLIRWTEALHEGKVLSKASLTEMTTPFLSNYGYGLQMDGEGAERDISHTGGLEGFMSSLDYIPATKTTVVMLSNLAQEGNQASPGTFALDTELVRLGMDGDAVLPSEGKEVRVPKETLSGYAGHYHADGNPTGIIVTFRNGRLFVQNDGGGALPLRAESASRFYLTSQETEIFFDPHLPGTLDFVNYAPVGGAVYKRDSAGAGSEPAAK